MAERLDSMDQWGLLDNPRSDGFEAAREDAQNMVGYDATALINYRIFKCGGLVYDAGYVMNQDDENSTQFEAHALAQQPRNVQACYLQRYGLSGGARGAAAKQGGYKNSDKKQVVNMTQAMYINWLARLKHLIARAGGRPEHAEQSKAGIVDQKEDGSLKVNVELALDTLLAPHSRLVRQAFRALYNCGPISVESQPSQPIVHPGYPYALGPVLVGGGDGDGGPGKMLVLEKPRESDKKYTLTAAAMKSAAKYPSPLLGPPYDYAGGWGEYGDYVSDEPHFEHYEYRYGPKGQIANMVMGGMRPDLKDGLMALPQPIYPQTNGIDDALFNDNLFEYSMDDNGRRLRSINEEDVMVKTEYPDTYQAAEFQRYYGIDPVTYRHHIDQDVGGVNYLTLYQESAKEKNQNVRTGCNLMAIGIAGLALGVGCMLWKNMKT